MLPKDWHTRKLRELVASADAGVSVNGEGRPAGPGEFGVLKISSVTAGVFNPEENKVIQAEELCRASVHPQADRILVSRSNTEALVGASAYVDSDHPQLFLPDKLWQLQPTVNSQTHMRWLSYWLSSEATRSSLSKLATGTSGSMKNIGKDQLLALSVPVPPPVEQRRIAQILSTWDQAIATSERLLANTTALLGLVAERTFERAKDASDQLPFREVFDVENHKAAQVPREDYLSVGALPIIDQGKELIGGYTDADDVSVAPPVVVFGDHTRIIKWADFRFRPGADGTQILRPKASIHPRFAFHAIGRVRLPNLGYSRHMSFLRDSSLQIPRSVDRQREIAQRLDVFVHQREWLASQVDALKREKSALMSQLLTGKRRVKLPDANAQAQP